MISILAKTSMIFLREFDDWICIHCTSICDVVNRSIRSYRTSGQSNIIRVLATPWGIWNQYLLCFISFRNANRFYIMMNLLKYHQNLVPLWKQIVNYWVQINNRQWIIYFSYICNNIISIHMHRNFHMMFENDGQKENEISMWQISKGMSKGKKELGIPV